MGMHVTGRLGIAAMGIAVLSLAAPAAAQQGRASGIVKDQSGKPIRGAVVRADNPAGYPSQITSTTDDKGRWGMIGLAGGEWRFTVEAPGYIPQSGAVQIRMSSSPPITFTLPRDAAREIPSALARARPSCIRRMT